MTRLLLHGALGVMGQNMFMAAGMDGTVEIVAGIDREEKTVDGVPVYTSFDAVREDYDVIVDFSVAEAADRLIRGARAAGKPLVLCTTGLSEEQLREVRELAAEVPVLRSANMSLGVNLLLKLVREAAEKLYGEGFDIDIVEEHHRRKKDAPSGTALALAAAAAEGAEAGSGEKPAFVFDRSERRTMRPHQEIGVSAVRGGTLPGVHDVIFAGEDEVLTLNHTAYSRMIFAKGAIAAAKYLAGKPAGMYSMQDLM